MTGTPGPFSVLYSLLERHRVLLFAVTIAVIAAASVIALPWAPERGHRSDAARQGQRGGTRFSSPSAGAAQQEGHREPPGRRRARAWRAFCRRPINWPHPWHPPFFTKVATGPDVPAGPEMMGWLLGSIPMIADAEDRAVHGQGIVGGGHPFEGPAGLQGAPITHGLGHERPLSGRPPGPAHDRRPEAAGPQDSPRRAHRVKPFRERRRPQRDDHRRDDRADDRFRGIEAVARPVRAAGEDQRPARHRGDLCERPPVYGGECGHNQEGPRLRRRLFVPRHAAPVRFFSPELAGHLRLSRAHHRPLYRHRRNPSHLQGRFRRDNRLCLGTPRR